FADSWAATHTALAELGMPVEMEGNEGSRGFINTRTHEGDRVRINVEMLPSRVPAEGPLTRVGVRVATFGDRPYSEQVLSQVGLHLALPGAVGTPPGVPNAGIAPAGAPGPPPLAPTAAQGAPAQQTGPPPLAPTPAQGAPAPQTGPPPLPT